MSSFLARKQFEQTVRWSNSEVDLARAALYLAKEEYSDLDPEVYVEILDNMAEAIRLKLPAESYPLRIIHCINEHLYDELGFHGNQTDYYNPENSYLNRVLERQTGIPITLSLVYLEVARRLNFPMVGINMPGHFLIRPDLEEMNLFVDPFNNGDVLFEQDCEERLQQLFGEPIPLQPDFFAPVPARLFLARILRNLKAIYLKENDWERALAAADRIVFLMPDALLEQRDRGLIYYQMGNLPDARHDLDHYLDCDPDAEDAEVIGKILDQISRWLP